MRLSGLTTAVCNFTRVAIIAGRNLISGGSAMARRRDGPDNRRPPCPRHFFHSPRILRVRGSHNARMIGQLCQRDTARGRPAVARPSEMLHFRDSGEIMYEVPVSTPSPAGRVPFYLCLSLLIRFSCRKFRFMTYNSAGR